MATDTEEQNPLALSDEDFLNLPTPVDIVSEPEVVEAVIDNDTQAGAAGEESTAAADTEVAAVTDDAAQIEGEPAADKITEPAEGAEKVDGVATEGAAPDYEAFYKQVMSPLKANGKTIDIRSPEELIQLAQMGANYTKKMQDLVPHRKVLTMLQNNGLLDEDKLSYLIDLDNKNPEAIKKLIKDSGIDPLEIDTASEPAYIEGTHRVSDAEVNFRSALDELGSTPDGKETLQVINGTWDQASKELLWKHPETLAIIQAQREVGIYDRIAAEMDRRVTLGAIPAGTPFLQAYKIVGDALTEANAFDDLKEKPEGNASTAKTAPQGQGDNGSEPKVVATRAATPRSPVANGDAASAASPTRAAPKSAQVFVNPLSMPDDEFMKTFSGRL